MTKYLLIFVYVLIAQFGLGQTNFVKNGGFDTVTACPSTLSQTSLATWGFPAGHSGSSDLFNECATSSSVSVPSNFRANNCPAFNGTGYIGGYGFLASSTYREYMSDTLKYPLVAGRAYVVSFMWKLSDQAQYASDDLGFYLSVGYPTGNASGHLGVVPTSHNASGNFLSDNLNWQLYSDTIIANGGEQYITIGAFDSLPNAIIYDTVNTGAWAYYFYDSVSIYEYDDIEQANLCLEEMANPIADTFGTDSVFWNFGDPSSGSQNTSTLFFPQHLYSDSGSYTITVIRYFSSVTDTLEVTFFVFPRQSIDLGPDLEFCRGEVTEFSSSQPYAQFLWHDSTAADTFLTSNESLVWCTVFGVCDTVSDTVRISYEDTIHIELGPDTLLCNFPGGYVINPGLNVKADFEWSTEDTTVIISVVNTGIYSFTATNGCNTEADTVEVTFKPLPTDSLLPADTLNCFNKAIVLTRPKIPGLTYVWSDSSTKATYTVDTTEQVWLAAFNECGFSVDTMNIVFNGEIISELGVDTIICDKDFLTLSAFSPGATYLWSTGDTTDTIVTGWHSAFYTVTVTYKDCQTIESKNVEKSDLFCPGIDCNVQTTNVFSPNGDGINDLWRITSDCEIYAYDLSIYNRWGQLVHFSNNAKFGWDGTINGEPASDGVYYYILHFKDGVVVDIDQFDFKGSITLVR